MNLQPRTETFSIQKEFLHTTQGMIAKVGGLTLNGSAFTPDSSGMIKAGSAVRLDAGTGLAVPHDGGTTAGIIYVTAHDVKLITGQNPVVGALEEAYLKKSVVQTTEAGRVTFTDALASHAVNGNRFKLR